MRDILLINDVLKEVDSLILDFDAYYTIKNIGKNNVTVQSEH